MARKSVIKKDVAKNLVESIITGSEESISNKNEEKKEKLISFHVNTNLYNLIKKYADDNNISIKQILNDSLDIYRRLHEIK